MRILIILGIMSVIFELGVWVFAIIGGIKFHDAHEELKEAMKEKRQREIYARKAPPIVYTSLDYVIRKHGSNDYVCDEKTGELLRFKNSSEAFKYIKAKLSNDDIWEILPIELVCRK